MINISFGECFGWLHRPGHGLVADIGVLLCNGLSQDGGNAHRPFRQLANKLADAGYPTVRFDYPGTGDSSELEDREPWTAWQQSIHDAADWMRATTDVRNIVLVGLRIGATLAAIVAEQRTDVVGLVLLEPVLRGRSYISQLSVEARLRHGTSTAAVAGIELGELKLGPDSIRSMQAVDLINVRLPTACRAAIFSKARGPGLVERVDVWRMNGSDLSCHDFEGLAPLLRPSHQTDEPDGDYSRIVSWLNQAVQARWRPSFGAPLLQAAPLRSTDWVEMPLQFGVDDQTFGMLCRPIGIEADCVVVIGNSSGNPHHGFARFSVELARRLAGAGIASLRIDFAGLGDSVIYKDGIETITRVFEIDRCQDMSDAVDALSRLGYRRFVAYGLCSGAYHALQAALADMRFFAALVVNLPWISFRHDRPGLSSVSQRAMNEVSRRGMHLLLLSGENDTGLKGLEKHFGNGCIELRDLPTISVEIVAGLDHDLTTANMRSLAADRMLGFLQHALGNNDVVIQLD